MIGTGTLLLRADPGSTAIRDRVTAIWPPGFVPSAGTHLLLIHGFNNSYDEARFKYAVFRHLLTDCGLEPLPVIELHWPGDGHLGPLSFASYPTEIRPARLSGAALATWIREESGPADFAVVTHSLGGRVILEAIENLRTHGGAEKIRAVCLMAAAVRVDAIEDETFGPKFDDHISWRILHSTRDGVLRWAFPIGQTVGGDGFFPRAVGRAGDPDAWPERLPGLGYGHGDYWSSKSDVRIDDSRRLPIEPPLPAQPARPAGDRVSAQWVARLVDPSLPRTPLRSAGPETHALASHRTPTRPSYEHALAPAHAA